jgi:hypothetical protein
MSDFEDITLIEANRKESNDADNTNPAHYTTRLGNVIELNIGDKVEVKSSFINQKGCAEPNSIEFKGISLGVTGSFTKTVAEEAYFYNDITTNLNVNTDAPNSVDNDPIFDNAIQGNLAHCVITNSSENIELKDNEANIEINFYKNANGEGYMMLPRSHPTQYADATGAGSDSHSNVWASCNIKKDCNPTVIPTVLDDPAQPPDVQYAYRKGQFSGICFYQPEMSDFQEWRYSPEYPPFDAANPGNILPYTSYQYWDLFNSNDYHVVTDNIRFDASTRYPAGSIHEPIRFKAKKPKNDNSRFTLFQREYNWLTFGTDPVVSTKSFDDTWPDTDVNALDWWNNTADFGGGVDTPPLKYKSYHGNQRDPAQTTFLRRTDLVKISIDKGFNSPESVANQVTQQLQEQDVNFPEISQIPVARDPYATVIGKNIIDSNIEYSRVIKTKTFKPIYSAGKGNMSSTTSEAYFSADAAVRNSKAAFNYNSAYHNILVKRPDLFEAGRLVNSWTGKVGSVFGAHKFEDPLNPPSNTASGHLNFIQNDIGHTGLLNNNNIDHIVTSWLWTEDNLKMLGKLFEVQGKYEELFENKDGYYQSNVVWTNKKEATAPNMAWDTVKTIKNSRFLHMNRLDTRYNDTNLSDPATNFHSLGDDGYYAKSYFDEHVDGEANPMKRTYYNTSHMSMPVFFKYMPENAKKMTDGSSTDNLAYGFATKSQPKCYPLDGDLAAGGGGDLNYYITLHPELVGGIRPEAFNQRGGYVGWDNADNAWSPLGIAAPNADGANPWDVGTVIGWDYHFNSFGNVVMLPYTGMVEESFDGKSIPGAQNQIPGGFRGYPTTVSTDRFQQTYIGANNAALSYDSVSNKFGFEYLHIPEVVGNKFNAGELGPLPVDTSFSPPLNPILSDAGDECYKINKRLTQWSFCPDMVPYLTTTGNFDQDPPHATFASDFSPLNPNLEPWVIYDSHCGINMNLGKCYNQTDARTSNKKQLWNSGLLGILGFSYDQFNPPTVDENNNSQTRVRYSNMKSLSNPTTNSQPTAGDSQEFILNAYGAVMDATTQLPYNIVLKQIDTHGFGSSYPGTMSPAIVIKTKSIKLEGLNLPARMQRAYLTIRADILAGQAGIGGRGNGLKSPIMAIINKINANKDFIQMIDADVFTVTAPINISSITTSIMDPDGTLALVDDNSSVIYKFSKMRNTSEYNIIAQIETSLKK